MRPGGDDLRDVAGVALLAQKMVGSRERYETFRMFCGDEDAGGVIDADGIVGRRMQDQQRLLQLRDLIHQVVLGDIVEKFPLDMEWAAGEGDLDLALRADVLECDRRTVR